MVMRGHRSGHLQISSSEANRSARLANGTRLNRCEQYANLDAHCYDDGFTGPGTAVAKNGGIAAFWTLDRHPGN
jgi:hypothetical protein